MIKRDKIIYSIVGFLFLILISFQNCSRYGLKISGDPLGKAAIEPGTAVINPKISGFIKINNNAEFTNLVEVALQLESDEAEEMYISSNSDCKDDGVWEEFANNKLWKLKSLNSLSSVYVKFRKSAESIESICYSASIKHDDQAPQLILDPLPQVTNNPKLMLTYKESDNFAGIEKVECQSDVGWSSACPQSQSFLDASEGQHQVTVRAFDKAGNFSQPVTIDLLVDLTAPTIEFNQVPAQITALVDTDISFSGADNLAGIEKFECQNIKDGAWVLCQSPYKNKFPEGRNQFSIRAVDKAGNISSALVYNWSIDLKVPTVKLTKSPNAITNSKEAQFEFTGSNGAEVISKFKCYFDTENPVDCKNQFQVNQLIDGKHKFSVVGFNEAGTASEPVTFNWLVDTVVPTVQIVTSPSNPTNNTEGVFTFITSVVPSGIKEILCNLDDKGFKKCESGQVFKDLSEGTHHILIQAVSGAGNVGESSIYTWRIDLSAPQITITKFPATLTELTSATFEFTATDGVGVIDKIECQLDGAKFEVCNSPLNLLNLTHGAHVLQIKATDTVGLVSKIESKSWYVDNSGPLIQFTKVPSGQIYAPAEIEIAFEVKDSDSGGIASVKCGLLSSSANELSTCLSSFSAQIKNLTKGDYIYKVEAIDLLGNKSEQSVSFTILPEPCILSEQSVPIKVLFIVDVSGSNGITDPGKVFRVKEIETLFNAYKNKSNFSWGLIKFGGSTASSVMDSPATRISPAIAKIFGNSSEMAAAIASFKNVPDSGGTPYSPAFSLAATGISTDSNKTSQTKYINVFISDGAPSDSSDINVLKSYVSNLLQQSPGQATLSTVYYGSVNAAASDRLSAMATEGKGMFINMNSFPQGTIINIEDIIKVPGPGCAAN